MFAAAPLASSPRLALGEIPWTTSLLSPRKATRKMFPSRTAMRKMIPGRTATRKMIPHRTATLRTEAIKAQNTMTVVLPVLSNIKLYLHERDMQKYALSTSKALVFRWCNYFLRQKLISAFVVFEWSVPYFTRSLMVLKISSMLASFRYSCR